MFTKKAEMPAQFMSKDMSENEDPKHKDKKGKKKSKKHKMPMKWQMPTKEAA